MHKSTFVPALLLALSGPSSAEPSAHVEALMKQPVSLFSFGLYRLDMEMRQLYGRSGAGMMLSAPLDKRVHYTSYVTYDPYEDRIHIVFLGSGQAEGWDYKEHCRQAVAKVRDDVGVEPDTGKISAGLKNSALASYFKPIGYDAPEIAAEALAAIDDKIVLDFKFYPATGAFACTAPLVGNGFTVVGAK